MRKLLALLCLLAVLGFLVSETSAQRVRPSRRGDGPRDDKNVFEVFGRLKGLQNDGKLLIVDIVTPEKPNDSTEVAAFEITGETVFKAIDEGKTLADYPVGTAFFIMYRSTPNKEYKGTALVVRRIRKNIPEKD